MENLSWRMMALALKKKKEEEEAANNGEVKTETAGTPVSAPTPSDAPERDEEERGRKIDKGKGKVKVVGFDGTNQDGAEDDELVFIYYVMPKIYLTPSCI
jgi:GATA-binding protein